MLFGSLGSTILILRALSPVGDSDGVHGTKEALAILLYLKIIYSQDLLGIHWT